MPRITPPSPTAVQLAGDPAFEDRFASVGSVAPIVTRRTSGDITVASTSAAWVDLDPSGGAAARNLDIVIPGVTAGQQVELGINCFANNGAGIVFLTYFSIVGALPVNDISGSTSGVGGWVLAPSFWAKASGMVPYTIQAGDIEDGNARFRARYNSGGAKIIYASGYPLICEGRGPLG